MNIRNHWIEGYVDPIASLEVLEKRKKKLLPLLEFELQTVQPIA